MTKTEGLNNLFRQWEIIPPYTPANFVRDGIINESEWEKVPQKILFVCKEPNDPAQTAWDFREWWQDSLDYHFSFRLAEWAYGLLNGFPEYQTIWKPEQKGKKAIQQVAFMNIKKTGGHGTSDNSVITQYYKLTTEFIKNQISIINPNLIVLCLSWNMDIRSDLFKDTTWRWSGYDIEIGKWGSTMVIDYYHPSARNAPAAAYSLLQNIVQSTAFNELSAI